MALAVSLFATDGSPQTRITGADVRGVISDETGGVLPGVTVTAISVETNVERVALSDAEGRYLVPALPPGRYRLTALLAGFAPAEFPLALTLGQVALVPIVLSVALEESVRVSDTAPLIDPAGTAIAAVISRQEIERLPSNGRDFISFAALTPGISATGDSLPGAATSGLSFFGQRPRTNNLLVDGLDNNDREMGAALVSFSQEAVGEFQVLTGNYAAEFGFATAGIVNIVTRSGTNTWSGSAFAFHRNEHLNARDHFERVDIFGAPVDRDKARYRQNQWGAVLGGPLRRDRTFVFGSAERIDIRGSNVVTIAARAADALTSVGLPVTTGPEPYAVGVTQVLGKMDQHWAPGHSTLVRVQYSAVDNENYGNERPGTSGRQTFGGIEARSHGAAQVRSDVAVSVSQLDVRSRFVHDIGVQFALENQDTRALDPTCEGPCDQELEGTPEVSILGTAIAGSHQFEPSSRRSARMQVKQALGVVAGAHVAKAGFDLIRLDQRSRIPLVFRGAYYFGPLPAIPGLLPTAITGVDALLLGLPLLYVQGYGDSASTFVHSDLAVFAQDDWRVSARFTLRAGLRYQRQFWPDQQITVSDVGGSTYSYPFPQDRNNLGLRVAGAYDLRGAGRSTLRGGYGRFYGDQLTRLAASTIAHDGRRGVRIRLVPFPESIAAWHAPGRRLEEHGAAYASSTVSIGPAVESPLTDQVTAGWSQAIGAASLVSIDAVWLRGARYAGALNYNPLVPALGAGRRPNDIDGHPGTSAEVFQYTDFGRSWYRGLLVALRHRPAGRLDVRASYTWSSAEDNSSVFLAHVEDSGQGRNPADRRGLPLGFDPDRERGPAPNDRPHLGVLSATLTLPKGLALSAIVTGQSGRPFTPLAGVDLTGDGLPLADRARRNPADPASSVGRHSERMRAEATADLRLAWRRALGVRGRLDLIVETFNVLNRSNFSEVHDTFGAGAFPDHPQRDETGRVAYGRYTKALPPRQAQLAVRIAY